MKHLMLLLNLRNGKKTDVINIKLTFDEEAIKEICEQVARQMVPEAKDGKFEVEFNHLSYNPEFIVTWVPAEPKSEVKYREGPLGLIEVKENAMVETPLVSTISQE